MTMASAERYAQMLEAARRGGYAYPAINVTSSQTLNAALRGFADAESDGIIQVSVGGATYLSGQAVNDRVTGSLAFAAFAHQVAAKYPGITVALHTDHCTMPFRDVWVRPLLALEAQQVARGQEPAFQSHMWDGSALPIGRNLAIARELLAASTAAHTVLEIEIGTVGGEEDGHVAAINEKLYSKPRDGLTVARALGLGEWGRYMVAFTFGNVHGAYKPGVVRLRPELLGEIQATTAAAIADGRLDESGGGGHGDVDAGGRSGSARATAGRRPDFPADKPFLLVFHGGSGSSREDIACAVGHGVVKMNVDTDTQYAFTRAIAGHMFRHYDGVLKLDGDVGAKQYYDPRSWGKEAELAMARRVSEACVELGSAGRALR